MSERIEIPAAKFRAEICKLWSNDWLLLTAGNFAAGDYNMMTVGWGSIGTMWGKPFAMAVVRPQRYTLHFMEKYQTFTLSAFPEEFRNALKFCGSKSGRDFQDKANAAGLTAEASGIVQAPGYKEAELVVECRKSYVSEMQPGNFVDESPIGQWYPERDFHKVYFGEIVRITGTKKYLAE